MKRSTVNQAVRDAKRMFSQNGWHLPPDPNWDVTDFGLDNFEKYGLVLVNLTEEPEYCEKLMYAKKGMTTPCHAHKEKKEDIIVRQGELAIQVWKREPVGTLEEEAFEIKVNGKYRLVRTGEVIRLNSGERITLLPGIYHEFCPLSMECIIGEVSTANDDVHDNYFINENIGRFSEIIEDELPLVKLVSDE